jgi:acyl carrier protein
MTDGLSGTERSVAALWSEVLTADSFTASDNFFRLGGDSVGMAVILFRIKEEFSVELPVGALFQAPTLRALSAMVDEACRGFDSTVAKRA